MYQIWQGLTVASIQEDIYINLWGYCSSSLVNVPKSTMDHSACRTNNMSKIRKPQLLSLLP